MFKIFKILYLDIVKSLTSDVATYVICSCVTIMGILIPID